MSSFKEIKHLIRLFTLERIYNYLAYKTCFCLSVITKKNFIQKSPVAISIEPVRGCNLSCLGCKAGKHNLPKIKNININLFRKIIDDVYKKVIYLNLYFQGEPMLNNELFEMIEHASKKKIFVSVSTNGHFLTETNSIKLIDSGLSKIIISVDGLSDETYNNYRIGGNLKTVIEGVKTIINEREKKNKKLPIIEIQMVVTSHNEHEINKFTTFFKDLGADLCTLKSAFFDISEIEELPVSKNNKYSRYKKNINGEWQIKSNISNRCKRIWQTMVINYNGDILPCCFDKTDKYIFGNAALESPMQIWKNKIFNSYRKKVLKNRKGIDICNNCTEGLNI